ncbi:MAG: DUF2189 domain-containing protein [Rhizobium sp.]|nr:DUF2189 domain-containing protein [Rhizobium sp.]
MAVLHVYSDAQGSMPRPAVRTIGALEVFDALRLGWIDFREKPSHYVFLCLLYPVAGVVLMVWSAGANMLPVMFPLASGFALLGPVAALGLYEISRRRELGLDPSWREALEVRKSPALFSIFAAAAMLFVLFIAWLNVAQAIYEWHFGPEVPASLSVFLSNVLTTSAGWSMMFWGDLAGLGFAVLALAISVVTFPLLLERDVGAAAAIATSVRATLRNPVPVLLWGLIVAALLVVGSIPLFAGLAVVLPVLGHATWHLYRKLVEPPALAEMSIRAR